MTSRGGNWISLGNYDLAASEQVAFSIYNTNATKTVVADGFRISKVVDCNALSTAEILPEQTGIELYPNPAKNQVHIKIGNNGKLLVVNFYNAIGQNVLTSKNKSVDISTLISGNYIVEILTDKLRETKKLIVK